MTADFENAEIRELAESRFPVVALDYVLDKCGAVLSDNTAGLDAIVRYAWSMGHKKIAFIHGDDTYVTRQRLNSFHSACWELGIDVPKEYVVAGHYHDIADCAQKTRQILELPDRPSLIIFPDDYSYIGGMEAIVSKGLSIPEDVSAIAYDGINMARIMKVSTYAQNTTLLGQSAARKLIQMIEKPDLPPEVLVISGEMMEGKTVRKMDGKE